MAFLTAAAAIFRVTLSTVVAILRVALGTLLAALRALLDALAASISVRLPGFVTLRARGLVGVLAVVAIIYLLTGSVPPS